MNKPDRPNVTVTHDEMIDLVDKVGLAKGNLENLLALTARGEDAVSAIHDHVQSIIMPDLNAASELIESLQKRLNGGAA